MGQFWAIINSLTFAGFDRDWAQPTYKLLRLVVVVLALVVGYPYIPGSSTAAFQGITLFLGIVASLGSSSAIANIIAGYLLIYRRAFKVGDLVMLAGNLGQISAMRLQATHLRTIKNEEVTIPNSAVMAKEVINYSALCGSSGLILHTKVVVGYETPWRQAEAMLLEAARRTSGLMTQPAPFVRELELGNVGVTYELNAYCNNPLAVAALYAAILRNVLDVFDENGIDMFTPTHVTLATGAHQFKDVSKDVGGTRESP
ncbi:MAG: mechanosensitive ion channel [Proteobacteria bacterium]|nr:mechanosensitive ion channel [Pseudomonadota bacterium]